MANNMPAKTTAQRQSITAEQSSRCKDLKRTEIFPKLTESKCEIGPSKPRWKVRGQPHQRANRQIPNSPVASASAEASKRATSKPPRTNENAEPPVQIDSQRQQLVAPSSAPRIVVVGEPRARTSWLDRLANLQQRVVNSPYFSWSVAAYAQLVLLAILAVLVIAPVPKEQPMQITVSFSAPVAEEDEVVIAPEPEPEPQPEPESEPEPEPEPTQLVEQPEPNNLPAAAEDMFQQVEPTLPEDTAASPAASAAKPKIPHRPKPEPPKVRIPPSHARIVGAFSAWTEPEIPSPGQPYVIVIQVTLPERITRYASSDLSGVIIGADGYRKFIQGTKTELLPITDHTARIRVPVIGAERGLKDSIIIQSRILRQRQLIELNYADPWAFGRP